MSAGTPYARLLEWAAGAVFPQSAAVSDAAKLAIAGAVRQSPAVAQQVCGLEFHHDGSGRVDFFLACLPRLCSFDGLLMPPWWEALLDGCDRLDPSYLLQGGPFVSPKMASLDALGPEPRQPEVVLPDAHSLEFDHDPSGIRLAGVFQWLCTAAAPGSLTVPEPSVWAQTWGRLPLGGVIGAPQPWQSGLLDQVRQQLGWPLWVGLMCGREDRLKLGFSPTEPLQGPISRFLAAQGLSAEPLLVAVACGQEDSRLSLDLDLTRQRVGPGLALECYPTCVTAETRSWELLDQLASRCALAPEAVSDAKAQLALLPQGQQPSSAATALQQLMPQLNLAGTMAAKLSHYKLSIATDGAWRLKSYISLTWKGA